MEKLYICFEDRKGGKTTVECKNQKHYDRLKLRFENRGWKQIEYVEDKKEELLPF